MRTPLLALLMIGCGGAAPAVENQTQTAPTEPVAEDGLDPIERGLDWSWREGDACKPALDDRDREFLGDYQDLCADAMARVTACIHDDAFLATQPVDMIDVEAELDGVVGTPVRAKALCAELGEDQFCGQQAGTYWDAYRAGDLRTLAAVAMGDCAATGATFPGILGANGGD